MQKKLIALAIAGLSSTAFAQSTVTIQGLFDTGYINQSQEAAGVKTKTNRWGSASNTATTNLTFVVAEDLGNNMKAGLWLETDPTAGSTQATGVWNSQNYLYVSGNFGKVSLGFMNNFALTSATCQASLSVSCAPFWHATSRRTSGTCRSTASTSHFGSF